MMAQEFRSGLSRERGDCVATPDDSGAHMKRHPVVINGREINFGPCDAEHALNARPVLPEECTNYFEPVDDYAVRQNRSPDSSPERRSLMMRLKIEGN